MWRVGRSLRSRSVSLPNSLKHTFPRSCIRVSLLSTHSKARKNLFSNSNDVHLKFSFPPATHTVKDILGNPAGFAKDEVEIVLHGWTSQKARKVSKSLCFSRLRDTDGEFIQLVDNSESQSLRGIPTASAVCVTGTVAIAAGGVPELHVRKVQVLNAAGIEASQLTVIHNSPKDFPQQYRYLQLRLPYYQKALRFRSNIAKLIRSLFQSDEYGFTEVETPLLFKSTPEGAREFLVPTRKEGLMYALPQSPQQYKQLLMASGIHRYFQFARCFRDEDLRADRQPEFTQVDLEMAFASGADVRNVVGNIIASIFPKSINKHVYTLDVASGEVYPVPEVNGKLESLTYADVLARFGVDKPDLRLDAEISNLTAKFGVVSEQNPLFPVIDFMVLRDVFSSPKEAKSIVSLLTDRKEYSSRIPKVVPILSSNMKKDWLKRCRGFGDWTDSMKAEEIYQGLNLQVGDVVCMSTRQELPYENPTPMGRLRQLIGMNSHIFSPEKFYRKIANSGSKKLKPDDFVATWVVDFPLFNPLEISQTPELVYYPKYDFSNYVSTHHPFTMVHLDDYKLLESNPLKARGQHYDLVINGVELGGGSTRIHDVELQKYIFAEILKVHKPGSVVVDPEELFGHLLRAFSTGCPPHAGFALGFDRLVAMMYGTDSIRDVIAFPKTVTGADVMIGSPSEVTPAQLAEYHLKI